MTAAEWGERGFVRDNETITLHEQDGTPFPAACYGQAASSDEPGHLSISDTEWGPKAIPALIALANAALPDDDKRKITRERLAALEEVVGAAGLWNRMQRAAGRDMQPGEHALDLVADLYHALQSYLPPE